MKKKGVIGISIPYLAVNLFLFIYNFFYGESMSDAITYYANSFHGENPFISYFFIMYNLYFLGFIFILISVLYLYRFRIRKAIIFGVVGTITFAINALDSIISYPVYSESPYPLPNEKNQLIISIFIILFCVFTNIILLFLLRSEKKELKFEDEIIIKKTILDLGTKFTRLETREISEKSGYDSDSIVKVLNSMISNEEIYAEYFKSSKTVSFDQRVNIDEIDELMALFRSWEEDHYEKLENN